MNDDPFKILFYMLIITGGIALLVWAATVDWTLFWVMLGIGVLGALSKDKEPMKGG